MLPPFLQKLQTISESSPADVADWSDDGLAYIVKDNDRFGDFLKNHFKGNLQTFVRQLHFYGFKKLDVNNGAWSFIHENFRKGHPDLLCEIRRKTRSDANQNGPISQVEVQALRSQVAYLQDVVDELQSKLENVLTVLDDAGVSPISEPTEKIEHRKRQRSGSCSTDDLDNINFSFSPATIDPLPVDSEFDDLLNLTDVETNSLLENEIMGLLPSSDSINASQSGNDMETMLASAEMVADATELDPAAVSKVLAYLRGAVSKELSKKSKQGVEFSYVTKKSAISRALPAQEVGAN